MTTETLYVKGLPVPRLDMRKKWIWNAHDVFYAQTKIPLWRKTFSGYIVQDLYAMCGSLRRYDFDVYCKWLKGDVEKSK